MTNPRHPHNNRPGKGRELWRPLVGLVIDYCRWTQLVPMVLAWAFLLIMVVALVVTNFQKQSFTLLEWGIVGYESVFGPIESPEAPAPAETSSTGNETSDDQALRFSESDLKPWVMKIWTVLALIGWLLGLLRSWLFGPREPMSLPRKLGWAALAGGACSAICLVVWQIGSEEFHGSNWSWIALFVGAPVVVWCVSAWSLSISHVLDLIRRWIDPATAEADHIQNRPTGSSPSA